MSKNFPDINLTIDNVQEFHDHMLADYVKQLDLIYLEVAEGRVLARLNNLKEYQFLTGAISGQVLMSAIDTVMSMAMSSSSKSQRGTLSQNNNFIRPGVAPYFTIESKVQRFGRTIAIGETKVYSENTNELICHATSTFPLK